MGVCFFEGTERDTAISRVPLRQTHVVLHSFGFLPDFQGVRGRFRSGLAAGWQPGGAPGGAPHDGEKGVRRPRGLGRGLDLESSLDLKIWGPEVSCGVIFHWTCREPQSPTLPERASAWCC